MSGCGTLSRYNDFKVMPENEISSILYRGAIFSNFSNLVFKVNADIYGRHLSGLLIVKAGNNELYKVAFIKEVGFKIFDIEMIKSGVKVNYAIKPFNNKIFMKNIEQKLRLLLEVPQDKPFELLMDKNSTIMLKRAYNDGFNYYIYENKIDPPVRIESASKRYKKMKLDLEEYKTIDNVTVPTVIKMSDYNIKLKIKLELLKKDDTILK